MGMSDLHQTATELVAPAKGILAADESTGTITKRFDSIGVGLHRGAAAAYRQMLFTTQGLGEHISGVILFDETIRQTADRRAAVRRRARRGRCIPGIKVDTGAKPLACSPARP